MNLHSCVSEAICRFALEHNKAPSHELSRSGKGGAVQIVTESRFSSQVRVSAKASENAMKSRRIDDASSTTMRDGPTAGRKRSPRTVPAREIGLLPESAILHGET
jgi:hypothetical protein